MMGMMALAMFKNWGFEPSILQQSKRFATLARTGPDQEAFIRASLIFSVLAVEAYFNAAVRGYIQANRANIDAAKLKRVEKDIERNKGIEYALRNWPELLTGDAFDCDSKLYTDYTLFRLYRNALVHSDITRALPPAGTLAQDLETVDNADFAIQVASEMIKLLAAHFGMESPTWV